MNGPPMWLVAVVAIFVALVVGFYLFEEIKQWRSHDRRDEP